MRTIAWGMLLLGGLVSLAACGKQAARGDSLVGGWTCKEETGGFQATRVVVFLSSGRYTHRLNTTKPGESFMSLEEEFGSWELVDDLLLLTIEGGSKYMLDTKPYSPGTKMLAGLIQRPDADTFKGVASYHLGTCALKRMPTKLGGTAAK